MGCFGLAASESRALFDRVGRIVKFYFIFSAILAPLPRRRRFSARPEPAFLAFRFSFRLGVEPFILRRLLVGVTPVMPRETLTDLFQIYVLLIDDDLSDDSAVLIPFCRFDRDFLSVNELIQILPRALTKILLRLRSVDRREPHAQLTIVRVENRYGIAVGNANHSSLNDIVRLLRPRLPIFGLTNRKRIAGGQKQQNQRQDKTFIHRLSFFAAMAEKSIASYISLLSAVDAKC